MCYCTCKVKGQWNERSPVSGLHADGPWGGRLLISNSSELFTRRVQCIPKEMVALQALQDTLDSVAYDAEWVCILVGQIF